MSVPPMRPCAKIGIVILLSAPKAEDRSAHSLHSAAGFGSRPFLQAASSRERKYDAPKTRWRFAARVGRAREGHRFGHGALTQAFGAP